MLYTDSACSNRIKDCAGMWGRLPAGVAARCAAFHSQTPLYISFRPCSSTALLRGVQLGGLTSSSDHLLKRFTEHAKTKNPADILSKNNRHAFSHFHSLAQLRLIRIRPTRAKWQAQTNKQTKQSKTKQNKKQRNKEANSGLLVALELVQHPQLKHMKMSL